MLVVTFALHNTALAPPPFDFPRVNLKRSVETCVPNPVQTVPLDVLPSLRPITTVTTVPPQQFTAAITTNSSLATQFFPNLSSCKNPSPRVSHQLIVTSKASIIPLVASGKFGRTSEPVVPARSRSPGLYCNPSSQTAPYSAGIITTSRQESPFNINTQSFMLIMGQPAPVVPASLIVQDLAQLLAASKKDHTLEWKLAKFNGEPLQRQECFDQFKIAIEPATLSDVFKLTYLETLVTGKTKTAIAELASCCTLYQVALRTLERKLGQPGAVVNAHLDKLNYFPALKMQKTEDIISYSATISAPVGVLLSVHYVQDLTGKTL